MSHAVEKKQLKETVISRLFYPSLGQIEGQFQCPTCVSWTTVNTATVARLVTEWRGPPRVAVAIPIVVTHLQPKEGSHESGRDSSRRCHTPTAQTRGLFKQHLPDSGHSNLPYGFGVPLMELHVEPRNTA